MVGVAKGTSFYEIAGVRDMQSNSEPLPVCLRCMSLFCVVGFVAGASFSVHFRR